VAERVAIEGCPGFSDDQAYRAMDFLLAALDEIAGEIFGSVAHLLNLDLDIVFAGPTSTCWECEVADDSPSWPASPPPTRSASRPKRGARTFGHSKDKWLLRTSDLTLTPAIPNFRLPAGGGT